MEFTKENVINLKEQGKSDAEIQKICGVNNAKFYEQKKEWGMVKGRGRKVTGTELKKVEKVVSDETNKGVVSDNKKSSWSDLRKDFQYEPEKKLVGVEAVGVEAFNKSQEALEDALEKIKDLEDLVQLNNKEFEKMLSEKDELADRLYKLRSEDVKVIDELKTKIDTIENLKEDYYNSHCEAMNELEALQEQLGDQSVELEHYKGRAAEKTTYPVTEEKMVVAEKCECSNDKVMKLEAELTLLENDKENLIETIRKNEKYKPLYYATVEALKSHLTYQH